MESQTGALSDFEMLFWLDNRFCTKIAQRLATAFDVCSHLVGVSGENHDIHSKNQIEQLSINIIVFQTAISVP